MSQDKILDIPLNKCIIDYDWNSRSGVGKLSAPPDDKPGEGETGGETEENEFADLYRSIELKGQEDPVDVIMKGDKYFVITGFRRSRAVQLLAEKRKEKNPTLRAIVKTFSSFEARMRNIRENTARKKLTAPDTARALVEARDLCIKEKKQFTIENLAAELGIGRPYANRLFLIEDKVNPKVLKQWHGGQVEVGVNQMESLAKMDADKQEDAFSKVARAKGESTKKHWMLRAEREAIAIGSFLGRLEYEGLISTEKLSFKKHLESLIKVGSGDKPATEKQRATLVDVITEAFNKAVEGPEENEEEEEEDSDSQAAE
jgi:ParB/RepB/Spo0J family partition protein